jgi:hypothetical protein
MDIQNRDFVELVKRTREKFDVSIEEAHNIIFADEGDAPPRRVAREP